MPSLHRLTSWALLAAPSVTIAVAITLVIASTATPARAEKADRQKPLTIEADRSSTVDLAKKIVVFDGRVVLIQGTLRMTADRVEVTEVGEGHRTAVARGLPEAPAEFREKRDGVDETVEGRAQSIEYDTRQELIKLNGKAVVRRMRGAQLADEFTGETIVWNGAKEFFSVMPPAAGTPGSDRRVRAVFTPDPAKPDPTKPTPASPAASAPASSTVPVTPSRR